MSPVSFAAMPVETETRDGWTVVLAYEREDRCKGPWLVDLSHRRRWDFQDGRLERMRPMGMPVPKRFGEVGVHGALAINRMNRTQVAIWHLGADAPPSPPDEIELTETTDGHCMLAFVGAGVPEVLQHLTPLDLFEPKRPRPFLTQGPVLHVPCQIVTFADDLVVMTLARGYGETFAEAVLGAGDLAWLLPGGEGVFNRRFAALMGGQGPS